MKRRHYFLSIFLFFIVIILSYVVKADDNFLESTFNGKLIFIPKAYDQGSIINPEMDIELIQVGAIYPIFSPSHKSMKELVVEKATQNYIQIELDPIKIKGLTFSEFSEKALQYSAQKFAEEKYGLNKIAEPYKDFQLQSDRWVEKIDGKVASYISCTTAVFDTYDITDLQMEPKDYLCSHSFFSDNIYYVVKFHNSLLPHWKEIQTKSIELIESFSIKQPNQNFLKNKIKD